MTINEYFKRVYSELFDDWSKYTKIKPKAPRIYCKDGKLSLSVQASRHHYCSPRDDFAEYYKVEVGYPSRVPPKEWAKYFDGEFKRTTAKKGVYGYVPVKIVEKWIEEHGGIDYEKTIRMWQIDIEKRIEIKSFMLLEKKN